MIDIDCSKADLMDELVKVKKRNAELELYLKERSTSSPMIIEKVDCKLSKEELKKSRMQLETELEDAKLLQSISMELLNGGNIQALYERLVDAAMKIMHSEYASMQMLHTDQEGNCRLKLLSFRGFNSSASFLWKWIDTKTANTTCSEALKKGHRIIVVNLEETDFLKGTEDLNTYLETGIHACQSTPLFSRSGKMLGIISTHWKNPHEPIERELRLLDVLSRQAADLIEQRQYEENLLKAEQEKREAIEAAMKLKDEFLYLITHEFKTPITVISSVIQTIEAVLKDDISIKFGKYLNMIKMNTNRQLRLVNNLLDITRYNSGYIKIKNIKRDIVYITRSIVNSVDIYARQKQIKLNFASSLIKKEIFIDEEKYERIMLNLLSNALKFTPNGKSIEVLLSVKKRKNKNFISVSVKDEGIGIPFDKQKVIFERFVQAETSLSSKAEGTGLGLHLVNILVNVLEGEILLESELDKGSIFTILLPVVKPNTHYKENFWDGDNQLVSSDERIIQAASIEFSDIYFD